MNRTEKVAISIPKDLYRWVERQRRAKGQSRSEFFCKALEEALHRDAESAREEQYRTAYLRSKGKGDEVPWAAATAPSAFRDSPWRAGDKQ
ncbi:MAG: hypothetical protein FJ039_02425 [Chloroflexi bacterium]|nr:hypothetical protein [Chloroflexota bacterium]